MKLGNMIKLLREKSGFGLKQIASEMGISSATLCRFENGKKIDAETLLKIVKWVSE